MINGRNIKKGDVVFDVLKGSGIVVNDGGGVLNVTVRFSEGNEMNFAQDGTFQGVQRLFWKQPFPLQAKGPEDEAYELTVKLSKVIYEFLANYVLRKKSG